MGVGASLLSDTILQYCSMHSIEQSSTLCISSESTTTVKVVYSMRLVGDSVPTPVRSRPWLIEIPSPNRMNGSID